MTKKNIIIVASLVFIILLSIGILFVRSKTKGGKLINQQVEKQVQIDLEYQKTQLAKNIGECPPNKDYNLCLSKYIKSVADCELIGSTSAKANCLEQFTTKDIIAEKSIAKCSSLTDRTKSTCVDSIIYNYKSLADCKKITESAEKTRCEDLISYRESLNKRDSSGCTSIVDTALKNNCIESIKNLPPDQDRDGLDDSLELSLGLDPFSSDTDGDKLSDGDEVNQYNTDPFKVDSDQDELADGQEVIIGTSPLNKDTDGDSYRDGPEFASKFNPCGEGALPGEVALKSLCENLRKK